MQDLYLDPDQHIYYYKGEPTDCVSDVLKMVDVISMAGIPIRNLEIAAERGTNVHKITEEYDYGEIDILDDDWIEENYEYVNYLYAYINFTKEHPAIPVAIEESIYSETLELSGTIDLVKYIDGKLAIVDKKTSKTISQLRSKLQLNAYRLLWNERHPDLLVDNLYILELRDNAEHRLIPIDVDVAGFLRYYGNFKEIKGDVKL